MEIEQIMAAIAKIEPNLAKRLEPLELANGRFEEQHALDLTAREEDQKRMKLMELSNDDLRKLLKATNSTIYEPTGAYKGDWPTRECAKRFGHFCLGWLGGHEKSKEYIRNAGIEVKAMTENVNSTGGALVPEEFVPNMIVFLAILALP